jgi:hypothetical protein
VWACLGFSCSSPLVTQWRIRLREQIVTAGRAAYQLDAQAIRLLREAAAEFAFCNSAVEGKTDRDGTAASDAITTILADAVARLFLAEKQRQCADALAAHLVWLSEAPLLPGRSYLLQAGAQTIGAIGDRTEVSHLGFIKGPRSALVPDASGNQPRRPPAPAPRQQVPVRPRRGLQVRPRLH